MKKVIAVAVILAVLGLTLAFAAEATKPAPTPKAFDKDQAVGTKVTCPVDDKEFVIAKDTIKEQYPATNGKWYYFDTKECKAKFDADPAKYAVK